MLHSGYWNQHFRPLQMDSLMSIVFALIVALGTLSVVVLLYS
jgi:hypothetical protein